ncbi:MAG: hypothetical protein AB1390_07380 [Nitrospirota bacterium]
MKEKFIRELTPAEKLFFLKKAREAILTKGYPADEDLYFYCYFVTLRERFSTKDMRGSDGYLRFLFIEGKRDIEEAITLYEEKLKVKRLSMPDEKGFRFIEYFSE